MPSSDPTPCTGDIRGAFYSARLPETDAKAMAARLREQSAAYRQTLVPAAGPRARLQMFERAGTALAQSAQIALAHLKRLYRSEGRG